MMSDLGYEPEFTSNKPKHYLIDYRVFNSIAPLVKLHLSYSIRFYILASPLYYLL